MDQLQITFNILFTIVGLLGGALLKYVYDAIKELRQSDKDLRASDEVLHSRINEMPSVYRRRDDSREFEKRIEATLVRIEAKLDGKVDKAQHTHSRVDNGQ